MSDWPTLVRALLASLVGLFSLLASLAVPSGDDEAANAPVVATVSDEPAHAVVTDEHKPAVATVSDEPASPIPPVAAEAIDEVRRRHGSLLDGTQLGAESADSASEFASALAKVAREEGLAPVGPLASGVDVSPVLIPSPPAVEGSYLLRQAARELERRAADNEDLQLFEEADHLRRLATRLRREARHWDERDALTGR